MLDTFFESIDTPTAVRGASRGFTVLVLGGLSAPLIAMTVPPLGAVWLTLAAVVAFTLAGARIGAAARPAVHGAVAATLAYLLVLPLVLIGPVGRDPLQIGLTLLTAVAVGGIAGMLSARRGRDQRCGSAGGTNDGPTGR